MRQRKVTWSRRNRQQLSGCCLLLLSLFPLLIAVGNVLPYLRIDPNSVLPYIAEAIPKDVYKNLEPAIRSLLTQRSGGLLSVSALAHFGVPVKVLMHYKTR